MGLSRMFEHDRVGVHRDLIPPKGHSWKELEAIWVDVIHSDDDAQSFDDLRFLDTISKIAYAIPESTGGINLAALRHEGAEARVVNLLCHPLQHLSRVSHAIEQQGGLRDKSLAVSHRLAIEPDRLIRVHETLVRRLIHSAPVWAVILRAKPLLSAGKIKGPSTVLLWGQPADSRVHTRPYFASLTMYCEPMACFILSARFRQRAARSPSPIESAISASPSRALRQTTSAYTV